MGPTLHCPWLIVLLAVVSVGGSSPPEAQTHEFNVTYGQFVYNPRIVINPPTFTGPAGGGPGCCNCTAVRGMVAAEMARLEDAYRRARADTERQLRELMDSVANIAGLFRKLPAEVRSNGRSGPAPNEDPNTAPGSSTQAAGNPTEPTPAPVTPPELVRTPAVAATPTVAATAAAGPNTRRTTAAAVQTTAPARAPTTPESHKAVSEPMDCSEVLEAGSTVSGVYMVQPADGGDPIAVYCDMETDGGGWTVFQRRRDGSVDFFRSFESYAAGFGITDGEFWLGNEGLHRLTSQADYQLRVDLEDFQGNAVHALYDTFGVADRSQSYRIRVGGYSGTAGDSLSDHNSRPFSAKDRDRDTNPAINCARQYRGAWWYHSCHSSNLNGLYLGPDVREYATGIVWRRWKGYRYSLESSEMKIRKKQ